MGTISAIETRYAGCRFRSRLEARWAVFFDRLGVPWEYEPEGYALECGPYLPDFLLYPNTDDAFWLEIKSSHPSSNELTKLRQLTEETRLRGFLYFHPPRPPAGPLSNDLSALENTAYVLRWDTQHGWVTKRYSQPPDWSIQFPPTAYISTPSAVRKKPDGEEIRYAARLYSGQWWWM
ncbi:MAG: hypothetical protein ABW022_08710, partial [Actinoplanes sp.]